MRCVHFVAFTDEQMFKVRDVFGAPDYVHPKWDVRAEQEWAPGDVVVYANNTPRRADDRPFFVAMRQEGEME